MLPIAKHSLRQLYYLFDPKVTGKPYSKIGSQNLAKRLVEFQPGSFQFWNYCLNTSGHSSKKILLQQQYLRSVSLFLYLHDITAYDYNDFEQMSCVFRVKLNSWQSSIFAYGCAVASLIKSIFILGYLYE